MRKKFSRLFIINILFYLNKFLYLNISPTIDKGFLYEIWSILPIIFIMMITDVMDYSYKNKLGIRYKVIADFCIKVLAFLITFYGGQREKILFVGLIAIMMIISIVLELNIKKELQDNDYYKNIKKYNLYIHRVKNLNISIKTIRR